MPELATDLRSFLVLVADHLEVAGRCSEVLYRRRFRLYVPDAVREAADQLRRLAETSEQVRYPERFESMAIAGLHGHQLQLKLESFDAAVMQFQAEGGVDELEDVFDTAAPILSSLIGAIPGFGSLGKELLDYLLKELRKSFRPRK